MTVAPDHAIPFIGLTGGLGSGKSTALRLLGELGCATISADQIVHDLYAGERLRALVVERWGDGVLAADGIIDRKAIAERVFPEPAEREWLQQQIWPLVGEAIWQFRLAADAASRADQTCGDGPSEPLVGTPNLPAWPRVAVVETPLLFEAGMQGLYDATIAVIAPEAVRAERAAARGHAAVDERNAAQLSQDEKAERADHVIVNDGTEEQLRERLAALLEQLAPA
ncbi:MAG: dephospho-CoA kinase [Solirubrobacteraceae bacterium]|nr:dephospho-CoA kinase [Solirubrobacteraceae bacterium]